MNVRELIEELNKIEDKELPVYTHYQVDDSDGGYTIWKEVKTVRNSPYTNVDGYGKNPKDVVILED